MRALLAAAAAIAVVCSASGANAQLAGLAVANATGVGPAEKLTPSECQSRFQARAAQCWGGEVKERQGLA